VTRVLITGSRDWADPDWIKVVLESLSHEFSGPITIIHGDARGADRYAAQIAEGLGYNVESFPAQWQTHGRRAGYLRNIEMVRAGADLCLAFIKNGSRGASMCADLAERDGVETRRYLA